MKKKLKMQAIHGLWQKGKQKRIQKKNKEYKMKNRIQEVTQEQKLKY